MHAPYTLTCKYLVIGFYGHYNLQLHYKLITSLELVYKAFKLITNPKELNIEHLN